MRPCEAVRRPLALRLFGLALGLAGSVIALLLGFGFLGALHPAGDSLAVFRTSLAGSGLVVAAMLATVGRRRGAGIAVIAPVLALMSLLPHWVAPVGAPGDLVIYQKNLHFRTRDASQIRDDILAVSPDVVTLQEVHRNNDRIVEDLRAAYPAQLHCPFHPYVGAVAILSRHPFVQGSETCGGEPGLAHVEVEAPGGRLTVATIHLHWPWPHGQPSQAAGMLDEIAALDGRVVVAGDFNMVRWSATVRRIARAAGTEPVGRSAVTYPVGPGGLTGVSIDHVLATGGSGTLEYRPLLGSDHRGIIARIGFPR